MHLLAISSLLAIMSLGRDESSQPATSPAADPPGTLAFLAGELLYAGGAAGHNSLVRQLPAMVGNARVISAAGLVVDPVDTRWNLHFDHDSQVELGKRYAQAMTEALGW